MDNNIIQSNIGLIQEEIINEMKKPVVKNHNTNPYFKITKKRGGNKMKFTKTITKANKEKEITNNLEKNVFIVHNKKTRQTITYPYNIIEVRDKTTIINNKCAITTANTDDIPYLNEFLEMKEKKRKETKKRKTKTKREEKENGRNNKNKHQ